MGVCVCVCVCVCRKELTPLYLHPAALYSPAAQAVVVEPVHWYPAGQDVQVVEPAAEYSAIWKKT